VAILNLDRFEISDYILVTSDIRKAVVDEKYSAYVTTIGNAF
jgi:hypothetical protein